MKLLVLGATGGCGRHFVRHAVARGHDVVSIVRRDVAVPGAIVRDDVLAAIPEAARGCDAVISCLGIRRRWPRNPWSRMISPPDFTSRAAAAIVAAARDAKIERVIAISAGGVADSWPRMSALLRLVFAHSRIGDAYRDLAAMEAIYAASLLDWTCVRPTTLTDGRARGVRETDRYPLTAMIPREAVALWMLDHLRDGARTPMITAG